MDLFHPSSNALYVKTVLCDDLAHCPCLPVNAGLNQLTLHLLCYLGSPHIFLESHLGLCVLLLFQDYMFNKLIISLQCLKAKSYGGWPSLGNIKRLEPCSSTEGWKYGVWMLIAEFSFLLSKSTIVASVLSIATGAPIRGGTLAGGFF